MTITTRIEQAGADQQRELLVEAWLAMGNPRPIKEFNPVHDTWYRTGEARTLSFFRKLDAEAYLSAAEMMVPDGVEWGVYRIQYDNKGCPAAFVGETGERLASTPALALLSAITRAREVV